MNTERLFNILSLRRRHNSPGEQDFIDDVLMPYDPLVFTDPENTSIIWAYLIEVGSDNDTLFTAHTDTVHAAISPVGSDERRNLYTIDADNIVRASGQPLGADDGAGVWLLLEMIDAGVPGAYLFPRGEECGGIGSSGIAKRYYPWLKDFKRAIAFDRRGTHSVITHQGMSRCCSDTFANALSEALTDDAYFFSPDDGGVFTDTANFTDDIAECTNVSIGYDHEHSPSESLDLNYLYNLRDKCCALDWSALPTVRKPGEVDTLAYAWSNWSPTSHKALDDDYLGDLPAVDIIDRLSGLRHVEMWDKLEELDEEVLREVVAEMMWQRTLPLAAQ